MRRKMALAWGEMDLVFGLVDGVLLDGVVVLDGLLLREVSRLEVWSGSRLGPPRTEEEALLVPSRMLLLRLIRLLERKFSLALFPILMATLSMLRDCFRNGI